MQVNVYWLNKVVNYIEIFTPEATDKYVTYFNVNKDQEKILFSSNLFKG